VRAVITPAEKAAFLIVILLRANRRQPWPASARASLSRRLRACCPVCC